MLIRMAPGTEERARRLEQEGQLPLLVPDWYRDRVERARALVRRMAEQERLQRDPAYREEQDRRLRDTRPAFFVDDSDPGRTVITVGAGELWREDLRELALRTKEKPDPKLDPRWRERADIHNTIDRLAEANRWRRRGRSGVWHIRNNPLGTDLSPSQP